MRHISNCCDADCNIEGTPGETNYACLKCGRSCELKAVITMKEFNVVLQKLKFTEIIIEAKNKKDAGQKAMEICEEGNVDWSKKEVEIMSTTEM